MPLCMDMFGVQLTNYDSLHHFPCITGKKHADPASAKGFARNKKPTEGILVIKASGRLLLRT